MVYGVFSRNRHVSLDAETRFDFGRFLVNAPRINTIEDGSVTGLRSLSVVSVRSAFCFLLVAAIDGSVFDP